MTLLLEAELPAGGQEHMDTSVRVQQTIVAASPPAIAGRPRCFLEELILKEDEARLQGPDGQQSLSWQKSDYFECVTVFIILVPVLSSMKD